MSVKSSISLSDQQDAFARRLVEQGRFSSVLAIFYGGQDHIRHTLTRLLSNLPEQGRDLQSGGFGEIHTESVPAALIATSHLGRNVSEMLLDVALVDLGAAGKTRAQAMAAE